MTAIFVTQRWKIKSSMKEGPPKIEGKREFTARYADERECILDEFENHTEGINIERIASFAEENGLKMVPYRLLYKDELPKLQEVLKYLDSRLSNTGGYLGGTDVVYVVRNRELEEQNGCAFTEGLLIHELVHSNYSYAISGKQTAQVRRGGIKIGPFHLFSNIDEVLLHVPHRMGSTGIFSRNALPNEIDPPEQSVYSGAYIEEGLAELVRCRYMQKFMDEKQKIALASIEGILPEDVAHSIVNTKFSKNVTIGVPLPLMLANQPGENKIIGSAPACAGLMNLCENIPELEDALWKARAQPEALREIPKIVNGFHPGLYAKLMKVPYDGEEFAKATKMIQDIVDEKEKTKNT
jgi:hypothetical protein